VGAGVAVSTFKRVYMYRGKVSHDGGSCQRHRWRGQWGFLTATVKVAVRPEPRAVELMRRYKMALQYAVSWVLDRSAVVKTKRGKVKAKTPTLREIHSALYNALKEAYGLPSKIAQDCYRNALAVVKSWLGNGARGKRPVVKSAPVWLTDGYSYRIRKGHVKSPAESGLRSWAWTGATRAVNTRRQGWYNATTGCSST